MNVNIGTKHGDNKFFLINTHNGRSTVPGYKLEDGDCNASLINSTEGVVYPQGLTKNSTLVYWRKTICRPAFLNFEKSIKINNIEAYKYTLRQDIYDRLQNSTADCYKGFDEDEQLPNGLSDVSKCYFGIYIFLQLFAYKLIFLTNFSKQIFQLLHQIPTFSTDKVNGQKISSD